MDDTLKAFGALLTNFGGTFAIFIPFIISALTAAYKYLQSVNQKFAENFRDIVKDVSSQDPSVCLPAVIKMGTFIRRRRRFSLYKGKYYDEVVDILTVRLYTELNYDVLNAIRGILQKLKEKDTRAVIEKLLNMNRGLLLQECSLKARKDAAKKELEDHGKECSEIELKEIKSELDKIKLDDLTAKVKQNLETYRKQEESFNNLAFRKQVLADFLATFLEVTKSSPLKKLKFCQTTLGNTLLIGLNLSNSKFENADLSKSTIERTIFDESTIESTVFTSSVLTKSNFLNCKIITVSLFDEIPCLRGTDFSKSTFEDVFFAGSDLTGAKFTGAQGLQPIYFYKAKDTDEATFDPEFKTKLDDELPKITEDDFKDYINTSKLPCRIKGLFKTLKELQKKEQQS